MEFMVLFELYLSRVFDNSAIRRRQIKKRIRYSLIRNISKNIYIVINHWLILLRENAHPSFLHYLWSIMFILVFHITIDSFIKYKFFEGRKNTMTIFFGFSFVINLMIFISRENFLSKFLFVSRFMMKNCFAVIYPYTSECYPTLYR